MISSSWFTLFAILIAQSNAQLDCSYSCRRGICRFNNEMDPPKCMETMNCSPKDGCKTVYTWQCFYDNPSYRGSITLCNVTQCKPPSGCKLEYFGVSKKTCRRMDTFCENNISLPCCKPDSLECSPANKECIPSQTVHKNTTSPSHSHSPKNGNLIAIISVSCGLALIAIASLVLILHAKKRRSYLPIN